MAKKLKRFNGTTWDNIDILASDSELLGGLALNSSTTNNQANKIIRTNASGETHLGLIKTTVGATTTGSANVFIDTGDGFIRKKTLSSFISELNIQNDTNNYLTGVTGSGNGTVTFARQGLDSLTWNASHTHTFASLTSKPTNLSGYGITDAASSTHTHGTINNNGGITATATPAATDFLLISDSSDSAKIKSAIELTGSTATFLNGNGTFSTPPNTNNYLTGVSGSGNGTVTFTRSGITPNLTWNASHTHSNYLTTTGTAYDSTRFGGKQLRVGAYSSITPGAGYITMGY